MAMATIMIIMTKPEQLTDTNYQSRPVRCGGRRRKERERKRWMSAIASEITGFILLVLCWCSLLLFHKMKYMNFDFMRSCPGSALLLLSLVIFMREHTSHRFMIKSREKLFCCCWSFFIHKIALSCTRCTHIRCHFINWHFAVVITFHVAIYRHRPGIVICGSIARTENR